LIKDEFLDSLPVWSIEGGEGSEKYTYRGQWHKKCFYRAQKEKKQWGVLRLKKINRQKRKVGSTITEKLSFLWKPFTSEKLN